MQLTRNFSLEELTASSTARRLGLRNEPGEAELRNLRRLAEEILQPVRDRWGRAIVITSGYRSPAVNKAVGGVATSQHLRGEAADINLGRENRQLYQLMQGMIECGELTVGQLLDENNGGWIHVSLPSSKHRNDVRSVWKK